MLRCIIWRFTVDSLAVVEISGVHTLIGDSCGITICSVIADVEREVGVNPETSDPLTHDLFEHDDALLPAERFNSEISSIISKAINEIDSIIGRIAENFLEFPISSTHGVGTCAQECNLGPGLPKRSRPPKFCANSCGGKRRAGISGEGQGRGYP